MSKEVMRQALEALQFALHVGFDESSESQIKKGDKAVQQHQKAITALREALAEQPAQQERGAWLCVIAEADFEHDTITLEMQCLVISPHHSAHGWG